MKYVIIAMRPYQWIKNFFLFLPLVFGQQLFDFSVLLKTTFMFFLFSAAASAVYLINDVVDLETDKQHREKRLRPLASGKITVFQAKITAFILGAITIPLSFLLDIRAGWIIVVYIVLNYMYMKVLKNAVIIDIFCIGAFFYLRILAGAVTSKVILSNWIILCTILLALFLAFNKRRYDLKAYREYPPVFAKYNSYFIDRMVSIISSSIVIAYALYTMDMKTIDRVGTKHLIYTIPFVYYGIFRYLYLMDKGDFGGDPTRILVRDHKMQLDLALWIIVSIAVIYFKL